MVSLELYTFPKLILSPSGESIAMISVVRSSALAVFAMRAWSASLVLKDISRSIMVPSSCITISVSGIFTPNSSFAIASKHLRRCGCTACGLRVYNVDNVVKFLTQSIIARSWEIKSSCQGQERFCWSLPELISPVIRRWTRKRILGTQHASSPSKPRDISWFGPTSRYSVQTLRISSAGWPLA